MRATMCAAPWRKKHSYQRLLDVRWQAFSIKKDLSITMQDLIQRTVFREDHEQFRDAVRHFFDK